MGQVSELVLDCPLALSICLETFAALIKHEAFLSRIEDILKTNLKLPLPEKDTHAVKVIINAHTQTGLGFRV